jgi:hypothetical protein
MSFSVQIAPEVVSYVQGREGLTTSDRERIINGIGEELGRSADVFLMEHPHPYLPNRFWYDYYLMTEALEVRMFYFACSAEGHVFGVTEVLYAEERPVDEE